MVNIDELIDFLMRAKPRTWAANGYEVQSPQRPSFKEFSYEEGPWQYVDSYTGYYRAPGQEVVRYRGEPIWLMSYDGGMLPEYLGKPQFAKQAFDFLKKALLEVKRSRPFRGPELFVEKNYTYLCQTEGTIIDFHGTEQIIHRGKEVFRQRFMGGLVIGK